MTTLRIDEFHFGRIVINGHTYRQDVIILPNRVLPNWWRKEGHSLAIEDLQQAMSPLPRILIIGVGVYGRMEVPESTKEEIEAQGVELMVMPTSEACEKYNQLRGEERVVAALHLTC